MYDRKIYRLGSSPGGPGKNGRHSCCIRSSAIKYFSLFTYPGMDKLNMCSRAIILDRETFSKLDFFPRSIHHFPFDKHSSDRNPLRPPFLRRFDRSLLPGNGEKNRKSGKFKIVNPAGRGGGPLSSAHSFPFPHKGESFSEGFPRLFLYSFPHRETTPPFLLPSAIFLLGSDRTIFHSSGMDLQPRHIFGISPSGAGHHAFSEFHNFREKCFPYVCTCIFICLNVRVKWSSPAINRPVQRTLRKFKVT